MFERRRRAGTLAAGACVLAIAGHAVAQSENAPASTPGDEPRSLLAPGDGRVPLEIRSTGYVLPIRVAPREPFTAHRLPRHPATAFDEVCATPCTLYVRPGLFSFETGGTRARLGDHRLRAPATGALVLVQPTSSGAVAAGYSLLFSGLVNSWIGIGLAASAAARWYYSPPAFRGDELAAGIFTIASVGAMSVGVALVAANPPTRIVSIRRLGSADSHGRDVQDHELPWPAASRRRNYYVLGGGAVIFTASYLLSVFVSFLGSINEGGVYGYWAIPGPGPLITAAIADYRGQCRYECAGAWAFASVAAASQMTGLAMLVYGAVGAPGVSRSRRSASAWLVPGAPGAVAGLSFVGAAF